MDKGNKQLKNFLILDDDPMIHELVKPLLSELFKLFHAYNVDDANKIVEKESIDFVISDLFLEGDTGDELSNNFIRNKVIPLAIPYCRMTSAPRLVPPDCQGLGIVDKREVFNNKNLLLDLLAAI